MAKRRPKYKQQADELPAIRQLADDPGQPLLSQASWIDPQTCPKESQRSNEQNRQKDCHQHRKAAVAAAAQVAFPFAHCLYGQQDEDWKSSCLEEAGHVRRRQIRM